MLPRRWHVYVVDLEPRVGTKPGKQRPCVAIQPNTFAESGLPSTVVLPLTTRLIADAFPLRVRLTKGTCGLSADSDVLVDQILAWDNELFRRDLGELPEAVQDEIRRAISEFLDL
jgi:mRNA interferase MazF